MSVQSERFSAAGKLTAAKRWRPDADTTPLEQDLATAQIIAAAEKVAAKAPPLRPEQIDRIVSILRAGGVSA